MCHNCPEKPPHVIICTGEFLLYYKGVNNCILYQDNEEYFYDFSSSKCKYCGTVLTS